MKNVYGAETILKDSPVHVILMDMLLSGVNGIDVCIKFKNDPALSHIPLIMMSVHPDAKRICMKAGANDFVSKPFDLAHLLLKLDHFITKAACADN